MKRDISEKLKDTISDFSNSRTIIVEGARQVGKSYLINSVLDELKIDSVRFDLEKDSKLRQKIQATDDFDDFKDLMMDQYGVTNGSILFLDEAQECVKLASYIKSFKEDWFNVKVILSGSSMNRLFNTNIRIPVGRYQSVFVQGFSFPEFIKYVKSDELAEFIKSAPDKISASRHKLLLEYYDDYLKVGGYPEAVKAFAFDSDYKAVTSDINASMAEDFGRKESFDFSIYEKVVRATANNLGMPAKLTHVDEKKYLTDKAITSMKEWHIIHEVELHSFDPKHSNFLPKRYLHDVGLASQMRSVATPELSIIETIDSQLRTPLGGLVENAVLISLLEGRSVSEKIGTWKKRSSSDIEVDFVLSLNKSNYRVPIECKASLKFKKNYTKNIRHYLEGVGGKFGIVVSGAPLELKSFDNGINILNLPVYLATRENIENYCYNFS